MRDVAKEERNRAIVLDYYDKLIGQWNFEAASQYLGSSFIQHNPTIPDGLDGLRTFIESMPPEVKAHMTRRVARVMADGDLVMVHSLFSVPSMPDAAIADIFRLEDGKVVEHWDVIQQMPAEALHQNGIV